MVYGKLRLQLFRLDYFWWKCILFLINRTRHTEGTIRISYLWIAQVLEIERFIFKVSVYRLLSALREDYIVWKNKTDGDGPPSECNSDFL